MLNRPLRPLAEVLDTTLTDHFSPNKLPSNIYAQLSAYMRVSAVLQDRDRLSACLETILDSPEITHDMHSEAEDKINKSALDKFNKEADKIAQLSTIGKEDDKKLSKRLQDATKELAAAREKNRSKIEATVLEQRASLLAVFTPVIAAFNAIEHKKLSVEEARALEDTLNSITQHEDKSDAEALKKLSTQMDNADYDKLLELQDTIETQLKTSVAQSQLLQLDKIKSELDEIGKKATQHNSELLQAFKKLKNLTAISEPVFKTLITQTTSQDNHEEDFVKIAFTKGTLTGKIKELENSYGKLLVRLNRKLPAAEARATHQRLEKEASNASLTATSSTSSITSTASTSTSTASSSNDNTPKPIGFFQRIANFFARIFNFIGALFSTSKKPSNVPTSATSQSEKTVSPSTPVRRISVSVSASLTRSPEATDYQRLSPTSSKKGLFGATRSKTAIATPAPACNQAGIKPRRARSR